jgi:hypothetical protein
LRHLAEESHAVGVLRRGLYVNEGLDRPPAHRPRGRLGPRRGAGRRRLDLPEDHDERGDLRRLAGDQLRQARAGRRVDIHLQGPTLQIWDGDELLKTVLRTIGKEVARRAGELIVRR